MNFPGLATRAALTALALLPCSLPAGAAALGGTAPRSVAPNFVSIPSSTQAVDFMVHLPLRNRAQLEKMVNLQSDPKSPLYRHWLTPAQFRANFGPSPAAISAATAALKAQGLTITRVDSQMIHVRGTASAVQRAFNVHLGNVRGREGELRLAAREAPTVPAALAAQNATVVGLAYTVPPKPDSVAVPLNRYGSTGPYWFDDLKQAYDYPAYPTLDGSGVTIATVGYSDFSSEDARLYFNHELLGLAKSDLAPAPVPKHLAFPGSEKFNAESGTSEEADLDVQQAAGSAPGATVVGIAAPTYGEGFLFAYSFIIDENFADIVSTSYGECELFYTPAYNFGSDYTPILLAYHDLFLQGNSQGITFLFSSGDDSGRTCPEPGYINNPGAGKVYKDVPGTSIWSDDPDVTSVGGTNLQTTPNPNPNATPLPVSASKYVSENANADVVVGTYDPYGTGNFIDNGLWGSGGGASAIFPAPSYQAGSNTGSMMRVSPDVAMHMGGCPYYGKSVTVKCNKNDSADVAVVGGEYVGLIGTSASSPEFAGVLAVAEQATGGLRFGNANVLIYELAAAQSTYNAFHQGEPGWNGVVTTGMAPGYNPIIGNGTPDVRNFIGLPFAVPAGNPQTPTNP